MGANDAFSISVPMIPTALFAILATVRLGAIHAVVFGGFAAASLAQRIEASKPQVVLTASCGIEGAKGPLAYKPLIRGALQKSKHRPKKVMIWNREELPWGEFDEGSGEAHWQDLTAKAKEDGVKADCVPIKSGEGLYIIYTSGQYSPPTCPTQGVIIRCSRLIKSLVSWICLSNPFSLAGLSIANLQVVGRYTPTQDISHYTCTSRLPLSFYPSQSFGLI